MARHSATTRQGGARGWRVSGYAADELLGAGASGEVWVGRDVRTGEAVALKRLRIADPDQRAALRREAAVLADLDHPHIVRLRAVVDTGDETVLVVDYVAGPTLAELLRRRGRLRPGETVAAVAPIAAALAHAHSRGVVHGDVAPANIVFTPQGQPMLTDLGVARRVGTPGVPIATTPHYADPMVAAGAMPTASSDVFAVAAVAFHALTGVPPWSGATAGDVFDVAASADLPDLDVLAPEASPELRALVRRALCPEPARRGDAAELGRELRHAHPAERVDLSGDGGSVSRRIAPTHLVPPRLGSGRVVPERLGSGRRADPPTPAERLGRPVDAWPAGRRWFGALAVGGRLGGDRRGHRALGSGRLGVRRPGGGRLGVWRGAAAVVALAVGALLAVRLGIAWAGSGPASPGGHQPAAPSTSPGDSVVGGGAQTTAIQPPTSSADASPVDLAPVSAAPASATQSADRVAAADPSERTPAGPTTSDPAASGPGETSSASPVETVAPPVSAAWPDVLAELDETRSAAFVAGDARMLRAVYSPGCPALTDDAAQIRRLVAAGQRVDQLRHEIGPVRVAQRGVSRVALDVTESLRAYRIDVGGGQRPVTAGASIDYRVELTRTTAGWRIAGIHRR